MFAELMTILVALGADIVYHTTTTGDLCITIEDFFVGFDDEYDEIERDLDDADPLDAMMTWLEDHCVSQDGDFYRYYHFDGFTVLL